MRRKLKEKKKALSTDYKYGSALVNKLVNYVMRKGKKSTARKVVYNAFDILQKETGKNPVEVFEASLKNVGPLMEVRSRRIGGANYQIPYEVRPERKIALAFRWIIKAAQTRKGMPMSKRLALELIDASNNTGVAVKKRNDTHRMAEANKAFAHFAW